MSIWFYVGIAIAVALGVNWGLKIHENPDSLKNLLSILWSLFKLLFLIGLGLGIIFVIIYGGIWVFDFITSHIELFSWVGDVIGYLAIILLVGCLILGMWLPIKEKGGFKKRWAEKKKKRVQRKKEIANLKGEEKKKYEKRKKDLIIIIVCLSLVFAPIIIINIMIWLGLAE